MTNKIKVIVFFSFISLIIIGCPEPPQNPPDPPRLVAKSAPEALFEKGIDAEIPEREQAIILMWHPNTETDLAGYKVYMNPDVEDSSFREIRDIPIGSIISVDKPMYFEKGPDRYIVYYKGPFGETEFCVLVDIKKENEEKSDYEIFINRWKLYLLSQEPTT